MHWMWIPLLVVAAILCALTSVFRLRSSIQKHTDELRRVMREMQLQTEQFTKVREATRVSKKDSVRIASELKQLHSKVSSLSKQLHTAVTEKKNVTESFHSSQETVIDLQRKLARCEARCKKLEADVSAASLTRWELLSKLHTNTMQHLTAISHLRQAVNPPMLRDLGSPPSNQVSEHSRLVPSVTKSGNESSLLSMRPDVGVSDDEEEEEIDLEELSIGPSRLAAQQKFVSLRRAPWGNAGFSASSSGKWSAGSIASGLRAIRWTSGGGLIAVSGMRNEDKKSDEGGA